MPWNASSLSSGAYFYRMWRSRCTDNGAGIPLCRQKNYCTQSEQNIQHIAARSLMDALGRLIFTGCEKFEFQNPVDSSVMLEAPSNLSARFIVDSTIDCDGKIQHLLQRNEAALSYIVNMHGWHILSGHMSFPVIHGSRVSDNS